ncbi:MAG: class I SAM-dependent RNA methyltransferase, partial [Oscillospiraceae bacterium]|nr:class I SAM-dependent RNA methyltransferase [Oscillospiraceae bacterium]
LGSFPAGSFDELFEGTRALPWEALLPKNAAFPVNGHCLNSRLMSVPDCQRIIKKAAAEHLKHAYRVAWCAEDGPAYRIRFQIMKDRASLCVDTSGDPLYKRGYRLRRTAAPLRETLAAGLVDLAGYRGRDEVCDPFCGSGTIAIEAALAAKNRAPGLNRPFAAMGWPGFDRRLWEEEKSASREREFHGDYRIFASDIDPEAVEIARENAARAGVGDVIRFSVEDAAHFHRETERGLIITNPPYGERLSDKKEAEALYAAFGQAYRKTERWKLFLLSAHTEFERCFGAPADKKRKLYNGMLKCDLFMYL